MRVTFGEPEQQRMLVRLGQRRYLRPEGRPEPRRR